MKNSIIILLSIFFVFSCKEDKEVSLNSALSNGNVEQLKAAKKGIQHSIDSLNAQMKLIDSEIAEKDPSVGSNVTAITVQDSTYQHYLKLQANLETDQDVRITPEYSGVMRLNVREGQRVRKGKLIATISDGGLSDQLNQARIQVDQAKSQVKQAEIQRDLAKTTFERQKSLWNQKIGSEMQFLQAKTNYETAQKQVQAAKQQVQAAQKGVSGVQSQLAKTRVHAPFTGTVEEVMTQNGQVVGPGQPIIRLVSDDNVKAVASVPEAYLTKINEGTQAKIIIPSIDKTINSEVKLVGSSINPSNRSFRVEVPIKNNDGSIKPNLNAQILLNDYTSENAIVVETNVLHSDAEGQYVFTYEKGPNNSKVLKKIYVETNPPSDGYVEITSGLKSGDKIIIDAGNRMEEGDRVSLSN